MSRTVDEKDADMTAKPADQDQHNDPVERSPADTDAEIDALEHALIGEEDDTPDPRASGRYGRCLCCGRYVDLAFRVDRRFCSEECRESFRSCVNCGRYYMEGEGYRDEYCSRECAVIYVDPSAARRSRRSGIDLPEPAGDYV